MQSVRTPIRLRWLSLLAAPVIGLAMVPALASAAHHHGTSFASAPRDQAADHLLLGAIDDVPAPAGVAATHLQPKSARRVLGPPTLQGARNRQAPPSARHAPRAPPRSSHR